MAMLIILAALACADLGPDHAVIRRIEAWSCVGDSLRVGVAAAPVIETATVAVAMGGCVRDHQIARPPIGKWFGMFAAAPGAIVMQYRFVFPNDFGNPASFESIPIVADTVSEAYMFRVQLPWAKWIAEVLWQHGRVVASDSLVWSWP